MSFLPTTAVPEMAGTEAASVPVATAGVARLVLAAEAYPDFVADTRTVMVFPRSAAPRVNDGPVAPDITVPERYHWYFKVAPDVHVPGTAVSLLPTAAEPEMAGTGADSVPVATAGVARLVFATDLKPDFEPVTRTEIALPRSAAPRASEEPVAPEIAAPDRYHWYFSVVPAVHFPGTAVSLLPTAAEPEMVGTGAANDGAATDAVALLIFATDLNPDFDPVTRTVMVLPRSAAPSINDDPVAPEIAAPDRYHWYLSVVPVVHFPGTAVSLLPTAAEPEMVGTGAANDGAATDAVALLIFATDLNPDFDPVTRTVMVLPRSAAPSINDDPVAPEIAAPDRYHWYLSVVPVVHCPGDAVSLLPTTAEPETVGTGADSVPVATAGVARLVFATDLKPDFEPVTRTEIALPRSAAPRASEEPVAPEIAAPDRYHWYFSVVPAVHFPGTAVSLLPTAAEPEMAGTGAANDGTATDAVALLIFATDLNPDFDPVTRTVMVLPRSAAPSINDDPVAPEIAAPDRYHWYLSVVPVVHCPGDAVSLLPTTAEPETVGTGADSVPVATTAVVLLVLETVLNPGFEPVTRTEISLPRSAAPRASEDPVALEIAVPDRYHWYFKDVPEVHFPGDAVSLLPTAAEPEMAGTGADSVPAATAGVMPMSPNVNATKSGNINRCLNSEAFM
ncbi:hypothetical protein JOF48_002814 [Arthrobacter stackebrandtii]|uniref:Uncharacterized protein n=1 Tax=Arthrobacter stackebrandtii TaxID=272161 RepID=A0ABS4YZM7_9MICC|nr:hypothetical protein [Arthrobacter stackebrandtii]MBP2414015.1 hypothetical protein [Arthrobacter stackebrandtii]